MLVTIAQNAVAQVIYLVVWLCIFVHIFTLLVDSVSCLLPLVASDCCVVVEDYRAGSYTYDNDSVTTNLYLGNINPKVQFFSDFESLK